MARATPRPEENMSGLVAKHDLIFTVSLSYNITVP